MLQLSWRLASFALEPSALSFRSVISWVYIPTMAAYRCPYQLRALMLAPNKNQKPHLKMERWYWPAPAASCEAITREKTGIQTGTVNGEDVHGDGNWIDNLVPWGLLMRYIPDGGTLFEHFNHATYLLRKFFKAKLMDRTESCFQSIHSLGVQFQLAKPSDNWRNDTFGERNDWPQSSLDVFVALLPHKACFKRATKFFTLRVILFERIFFKEVTNLVLASNYERGDSARANQWAECSEGSSHFLPEGARCFNDASRSHHSPYEWPGCESSVTKFKKALT